MTHGREKLYSEILSRIAEANRARAVHRQRAWQGSEAEASQFRSEMIRAAARSAEPFAQAVADSIEDLYAGGELPDVTSIEDLGGDAHSGMFPLKINAAGRGPLIFKPRSAWSERCLQRVLADVGGALGLSWPPLSVTETASGSLWEVVPHDKPLTTSRASKYYYAAGVLLAASHALRLSDLNHENIIANEGFPSVVDAEFICQPSMELFHPAGLRETRRAFEDSVLATLMLPLPDRHPDPSGLGLSRGSRCANGRWSASKHLPVNERGECYEARDYLIEIVEGFRDAYLKLLDYRNALVETVSRDAGLIRVAVRPTDFYVSLEERLWGSPTTLNDPEGAAERLRGELRASLEVDDGEVVSRLVKSEAEALLRGDIPIFFARLEEDTIYSDKIEPLGRGFPCPPLDSLRARLSSMRLEDVEEQVSAIQQSLVSNMARRETRSTAALTRPS